MIRAALFLAAAARAAAPLDADTTKRLDQLQQLLLQNTNTALPTWTATRRDADVVEWTSFVNGSAKAGATGALNGTRVARKRSPCADPRATLKPTRAKSKRPLPVEAKHFAEAVAELYFMEHLRGRPGVPVLRGAWYTDQGLEYVVDHAGPPLLMKKVANKHPLTDFHQAVDNAALRRPLLLARALLECVPVRKRISSTRNGACLMARTTVDAPAGASGPSPRKEATSSTTSPGSSSACGRRPVFHQW